MSHQVTRAAVIGAGQMGLGIAYVTALFAKLPVGLHDPSSNGLKRAMENLDKIFARDVAKNRFSQDDVDAARARITPVQGDGTDANGGNPVHADTDIVIEVSVYLELCRARGNSDGAARRESRATNVQLPLRV
jgi:3-hydroxybutyryl-CoA dehydrogenase